MAFVPILFWRRPAGQEAVERALALRTVRDKFGGRAATAVLHCRAAVRCFVGGLL